eukprot:7741661-Alexandrium_andersonii.AAC.1
MKDGVRYDHLRRVRVRFRDGMLILPCPAYIKAVLRALDMEGCAGAPTPVTNTPLPLEQEGDELEQGRAKIYRSCVGVLIYLSNQDRFDIQVGVSMLAMDMATPREA